MARAESACRGVKRLDPTRESGGAS